MRHRLLGFLKALNRGFEAVLAVSSFFVETTSIGRNCGSMFLLRQSTGLQLSVLMIAVKQLEAFFFLCHPG